MKLGTGNKEGLGIKERAEVRLLWLSRKVSPGRAMSHGESEKRGPWRQVRGISLGRAAAAHCVPGCKSCRVLWNLGDACPWGKRKGKGKVLLEGGVPQFIAF